MIKIPGLVEEETMQEVLNMVAEKAQDGMVFVEVGCLIGSTICFMGQRLKELNKKVKLSCVDLWICDDLSPESRVLLNTYDGWREKFEENIKLCGINDMIEIFQMDSIEASKLFEDKSVDFLFLDGCHRYPYTLNEIKSWLPKMKDNSIIGGHDFSTYAISQAVYEIFNRDKVHPTSLTNAGYYAIVGNGL